MVGKIGKEEVSSSILPITFISRIKLLKIPYTFNYDGGRSQFNYIFDEYSCVIRNKGTARIVMKESAHNTSFQELTMF